MFAAACDARVPSFGVQINDQVFNMAAQEILLASMNTTLNGTLMCGLGIQPGVEEAGAMGDPFLSNVVAVFDIGASEMRFARRAPAGAVDASGGGLGGVPGSDGLPDTSSSKNHTDQDGPSCHAVRPGKIVV